MTSKESVYDTSYAIYLFFNQRLRHVKTDAVYKLYYSLSKMKSLVNHTPYVAGKILAGQVKCVFQRN